MKANLETQRIFIELVKDGYIIVLKNGFAINTKTGKIYDKPIGSNPYISISVKVNGKKKAIQLHRLLWLVWKGWLKSWEQINHIDGVKTHNRLSNLEKTNNTGNVKHAFDLGLTIPSSGESHTKAILTQKKVKRIRKLYKLRKYNQYELASIFNVSRGTIFDVVSFRTWKNI